MPLHVLNGLQLARMLSSLKPLRALTRDFYTSSLTSSTSSRRGP